MSTQYFCEGFEKAVVEYSQLTGAGLIVEYPTDGTEDDFKQGATGTTVFLPGMVFFDSEASIDPEISRYDVYFKSVSNMYADTYPIIQYDCGSDLYHVAQSVKAPNIDAISVIPVTQNNQNIIEVTGTPSGRGRIVTVSQEMWEARYIDYTRQDWTLGYLNIAENCNFEGISDNYDNVEVAPGTAVLEEIVGNKIYYQVKAHFEPDEELIRRLSRSERPLSMRLADSETVLTTTVEINLDPDNERLMVQRGTNRLDIFINNTSTGQFIFLQRITPFSFDSRNTYTVDCLNTEECPEGTCKVICGAIACCYNSQGIAVSSFSLTE